MYIVVGSPSFFFSGNWNFGRQGGWVCLGS